MMRVKLVVPNAGLFTKLMKAVNIINEEVIFDFKEENITISTIDAARISLVKLSVSGNFFEEYDCEKPVKFCAQLIDLMKILSGMKGGGRLALTIEGGQSLILEVERDGMEKRYGLRLLESELKDIPNPSINWRNYAKLSAAELYDAVTDCELVDDYMNVKISPDGVVFHASGELGGATIKYPRDSPLVQELSAEKEESAKFNINYMKKIAKAGEAISDFATIKVMTNKPIQLIYPLDSSGELTYLVAPVV